MVRRCFQINSCDGKTKSSSQALEKPQRSTLIVGGERQIGYVVMDAKKWEKDLARTASEFDADYYERLLEKA